MGRCILIGMMLLCLPNMAWAFPDNPVLDTFTGCVDTTTPPNSNWTNAVFFGASSSTMDCEDTAATNTTNGTEGEMYWNVSTFGPNCEAYATVVTLSSFVSAAVFCRLANIGASTTDGYFVAVEDATNILSIYRLDNGAATKLGSDVSQTIAAGDAFGIRASGSSICSWYKTAAGSWTQKDCQTDSTYTAGGRIGVSVDGTDGGIGKLDNFGGGNLRGAPGAPILLGWLQHLLFWMEPNNAYAQ